MAFEETREQQQMYNYFRSCIYIFLIIEIVMNLPITADNRVTQFILDLLARFKVFNSVVVLFSGSPGPNNNMYTMTYYIYEQINTSLEYGRAAAASLILFVIILLFTMLQRFIQRKWKYD